MTITLERPAETHIIEEPELAPAPAEPAVTWGQRIMCSPSRSELLRSERVAWDVELVLGALFLLLVGWAVLTGTGALLSTLS